MIHEVNVPPGVANKMGMRFTKNVAVGFPYQVEQVESLRHARVTGVPLRTSISTLHRQARQQEARAHFGLHPHLPTLFVFGASQTRLSGTVTNIHKPSDIEGVYGGAGAGATLVGGVRVITMTNGKGAHLRLQGGQVGLMVNADLSGMSVSLR